MTGTIDSKLAEMGITLPDAPAPAANYVPYVVVGDMVYISGQTSKDDSGLICGRLGDGYTVEQGQAAARVCALNIIAQAKAACGGDLDRVDQVVRLGGFVNCTSDFTDQPAVVNGASDLMGEVFGAKGAHARAAVGCTLPLGVAAEVDAIIQIK